MLYSRDGRQVLVLTYGQNLGHAPNIDVIAIRKHYSRGVVIRFDLVVIAESNQILVGNVGWPPARFLCGSSQPVATCPGDICP